MRGVLGEGGFGTVVMVKNGEQMSAHVPWMTGLQKGFFFAKCLPSWPPSPEIRTAHAKFTDFHVCVFRISACADLVSPDAAAGRPLARVLFQAYDSS